MELKGIQYIIPAFSEILKQYPHAHLILANAVGSYQNEIRQLLKSIPAENYTLIKFEKDIFSLYQLFDIFIHVPVDPYVEAYGQVYVEALAAKVPSVFTLSGIAKEFIVNRENALVVDYKNPQEITNAIQTLVNDKDLCNAISTKGFQDVKNRFTLSKMIGALERIYL
jgi:glycosyltransferase involved in cell wall biosynthesis